jgi:hypothetical protein
MGNAVCISWVSFAVTKLHPRGDTQYQKPNMPTVSGTCTWYSGPFRLLCTVSVPHEKFEAESQASFARAAAVLSATRRSLGHQ